MAGVEGVEPSLHGSDPWLLPLQYTPMKTKSGGDNGSRTRI
jgi:hypothetical protein